MGLASSVAALVLPFASSLESLFSAGPRCPFVIFSNILLLTKGFVGSPVAVDSFVGAWRVTGRRGGMLKGGRVVRGEGFEDDVRSKSRIAVNSCSSPSDCSMELSALRVPIPSSCLMGLELEVVGGGLGGVLRECTDGLLEKYPSSNVIGVSSGVSCADFLGECIGVVLSKVGNGSDRGGVGGGESRDLVVPKVREVGSAVGVGGGDGNCEVEN